MVLLRQFARRVGGVRTPINPTTVTLTTRTLAGVAVQSGLVASATATTGLWSASTTNALYTSGTSYRASWTATVAGYTWTKTTTYVHYTAGTVVTVGPPTVGLYSFTDTTATFTNTLGTNAITTLITVMSADGGLAVTATGAGAYITVSGLSPSTLYFWAAQGVGSGGELSALTAGTVGMFTTLAATPIAKPLLVKLFVNHEGTQHPNGPFPLDVEHRKGVLSAGSDFAPMAQGHSAYVLFEGGHAIWWKMVQFTVRYLEEVQAPFGVGERSRPR